MSSSSGSDSTKYIQVYAGVVYPLVFCMCIGLVYYYRDPRMNKVTSVLCVLTHFCTFGILFTVPMDIATVVTDRRIVSEESSVESYVYDILQLNQVYNALFVIILVMTSAVLVFMEYYDTDGYFTWVSRVTHSLQRMVIDQGMAIVVALILLGVLIGQKVVPASAAALELSLIIVTNIIYEAFLMFLLGYGLVEFPRGLWMHGNLKRSLTHAQTIAYNDFKNMSNSQIAISQVVANILKTKAEKEIAINRDPTLKEAMDVLVGDCPSEFRSMRHGEVQVRVLPFPPLLTTPAGLARPPSLRDRGSLLRLPCQVDKNHEVTVAVLARLRTELNVAVEDYRIVQSQVEATKLEAYRLMNIEEAKATDAQTIKWTETGKESTAWEYRWYVTIRPILYRLAGVVAALMSVLSLIGIISSMTGAQANSSPFFLALHMPRANWSAIAIFVIITLGYATFVAYWSLMQMQFGGAMRLQFRRTSAVCLSFSTRMCARLASPLAFFYLGWVAESGLTEGKWLFKPIPPTVTYANVTTSSFHLVNGHNVTTHHNVTVAVVTDNDVLMRSSFSNFYQIYKIGVFVVAFRSVFPVLLLLIMILVIFNVLNWLLVKLRLSAMQMGTLVVPEEQLAEGKRKLDQYKVSTERTMQRGDLKARIQESLAASRAQEEGKAGTVKEKDKDAPTAPALVSTAGKQQTAGKSSLLQVQVRSDQLGRFDADDDDDDADGMDTARAAILSRQPREINGIVERKEHSGVFGLSHAWRPYKCAIMPPGMMVFQTVTNEHGAQPQKGAPKQPPRPIDLSLVIAFTPGEEAKNHGRIHDVESRLNLELSDDVVKLKFKSAQDMKDWKVRLDTSYRRCAVPQPYLHTSRPSSPTACAPGRAATVEGVEHRHGRTHRVRGPRPQKRAGFAPHRHRRGTARPFRGHAAGGTQNRGNPSGGFDDEVHWQGPGRLVHTLTPAAGSFPIHSDKPLTLLSMVSCFHFFPHFF